MVAIVKIKSNNPTPLNELLLQMEEQYSVERFFNLLQNCREDLLRYLGLRVFDLDYGGLGEPRFVPTSYVGRIWTEEFRIDIEPKIPNLDLNNILYMAFVGNKRPEVLHYNTIVEDSLDDDIDLDAAEFFIKPFLSLCVDIIKSGPILTHQIVTGSSKKVRGMLDVRKQAPNGNLGPYKCKWNESSIDVPENKTIKLALYKSIKDTKNDVLKRIASKCLESFQDVNVENWNPVFEISNTTLRRLDYEKALRFARFILEGYDPMSGAELGFIPPFVLDLDEVFESYITSEILRLMPDNFEKKAVLDLGTNPLTSGHIELDGLITGPKGKLVIDAKNKYTAWGTLNKNYKPNNPDLYQMLYYASRIGAKKAVLVYPSTKKDQGVLNPILELDHESKFDLKVVGYKVNVTGSISELSNSLHKLAEFLWESVK